MAVHESKSSRFYFPSLIAAAAVGALTPGCSSGMQIGNGIFAFKNHHMRAETVAAAQPSAKDVAVVLAHLNYPDLTVLLAVNDVPATEQTIAKAGGEIVYDPNLHGGSSIPFLVANLPPTKIIDSDFIKSLNLKAIDVENPEKSVSHLEDVTAAPAGLGGGAPAIPQQLYVPTQEVNIPQLRAIDSGKGLGEKTIVAVIDTGVDASHPVFQDRVIYWADETQEGRFMLTPAKVAQGKIQAQGYEGVVLPAQIQANATVYVGAIDEAVMSTQLSDTDKTAGKKGIDLNRNGTMTDRFPVLVGKDATTGEWIAFVDTDGDGTFDKTELATPYMDFNDARAIERQGKPAPFADLLRFPSEAATIAYPLIFETDANGDPEFLTVGFDGIDHGTHVAGIIGANGGASGTSGPAGLVGAAPDVEIMALKICSGLTCTDEAMIRALIEAFYNPKGYIPDVVNLSIGSLQGNSENVMDYLFRDLSEKFGATFVIANGNEGPAYRTGNSTGAFAPTIQVGAYVSKNTLAAAYTGNPGLASMPDDSLFYFTSLGPSFTGELRPNIVAPGSALSSIPLADGGSEMMQGTSMATPMTTGAVAAMISLARSEGLLTNIDALRAQKAQSLRTGSPAATGSLIGIPIAIRSALEDSARQLQGYTMPQQGFGLVQIDRAYDRLKAELATVGKQPYVQFEINGDAAAGKLYDRGYTTAPSKAVQLALRPDGELTDQESLAIQTTPVVVKLEKVEIQDAQGNVTLAQAPLPFAVGIRNGEAPDPTTTNVTLSDPVQPGFYSIRHLDQMQTNHTYIAHYDLFQNGIRMQTITDVVHRPIQLGDGTTQVYVPGVTPGVKPLTAAYGVRGVEIAPNAVHRYFIDVSTRDSALKLGFGLSPGAQGALIYQVNDPDGGLVDSGIVGNIPALGAIPSAKTVTEPLSQNDDGTNKVGIYEVTVNNGSVSGMIPTKYDLAVQAIRFKPSADHINVSTLSSKSTEVAPDAILTIMNSSREVSLKSLVASLDPLMLMESLKPFPVIPDTLTLKRIHVPPVDADGAKTTTVTVQYGATDTDLNMDGRIDNNLYMIQNGSPVIAYTADPTLSEGSADPDAPGGSTKVFRNVKRPDPKAPLPSDDLYAAVETYMIEPTGEVAKKGFRGIDVEVTYDVPAQTTGDGGIGIDADASTQDVFVVDIASPKAITNVSPDIQGTFGPKARANLHIGTSDGLYQITIPVTLEQ